MGGKNHKWPEDNRRVNSLEIWHKINISPSTLPAPHYPSKQRWERTRCSLLRRSEWWWNFEVLSVREKRRRGGAGLRETRPPKINLHEGGKRVLGRRRKKKRRGSSSSKECRGKQGERGECLRLQRIKNCAISRRTSPPQMKLVCGHEGLAPWYHPRLAIILRDQRGVVRWARAFWRRRLWNNFARWCVCHIISSYSGFITQLRRHFTVCDSKILLYDMMKVLTDRALRRSFTARDESNCAVAFLACIFTMRTCEEKKPPPSLTLRALAGKDRHFLDFMHHVNTAYGSGILRLLYSNNSRIMLPWVTRCEMRRNVSETWSVPAFNFLTGWWN